MIAVVHPTRLPSPSSKFNSLCRSPIDIFSTGMPATLCWNGSDQNQTRNLALPVCIATISWIS